MISTVIAKETLIFEDKLIVDNALALWGSCIMEKSELVKEFLAL
jgi:hypothetical protein